MKNDRTRRSGKNLTFFPGFLFFIGIGLLLMSLLSSPRILAFLFSSQTELAADVDQVIKTVRVALFLAGCSVAISGLLVYRYKYSLYLSINNMFLNVSIFLIVLIFCIVLIESIIKRLDPLGASQFREARKYFSQAVINSEEFDLGYVQKAGFEDTIAGIPMEINSKRLRDREYSYKKPQNVFRIVSLGDSVTLGWGVRLENSFPKKLEGLLNAFAFGKKFEVINAGVGGYNTVQEAAFFRSEIQHFETDLVLLFFTINDAGPPLEPFPEPKARPKDRISNLSHVLIEVLKRLLPTLLGLIEYLSYPNVDYLADYQPATNEGWKRSEEALRSIKRISMKNGSELIIFMIPAMQNLNGDYPYRMIHSTLQQFCEKEGIPFFDLYSFFEGKKNSDVRVSPVDGHPNKFAHDVIAQSVQNQLFERDFLSSSQDTGELLPATQTNDLP